MRATPTLASDVGELIWRMLERERTGIHHCCGGESVTRAELARATVRAFDLDASLLRFGPPPPPAAPVPYDTSIDGTADRRRARRRIAGRRGPARAPAGAAAVMKLPPATSRRPSPPRPGWSATPCATAARSCSASATGSRPTRRPARRWASRSCTRGRTGSARGPTTRSAGRRPARQAGPRRRRDRPADARHAAPPVAVLEPGVAELDGASDAFPFAHTVRLRGRRSATRCGSRPRSRPTTGPCR